MDLLDLIKNADVPEISVKQLLLLLPNVARRLKRELTYHRTVVEGPVKANANPKEAALQSRVTVSLLAEDSIQVIRASSPQVEVTIEGTKVTALIDTGSEVSTVSQP
jgi:hypothetical protein